MTENMTNCKEIFLRQDFRSLILSRSGYQLATPESTIAPAYNICDFQNMIILSTPWLWWQFKRWGWKSVWEHVVVSIHSFVEVNTRFMTHYFDTGTGTKKTTTKNTHSLRKWKKREVAPKDKWMTLYRLNRFKIIPNAHNLLLCQFCRLFWHRTQESV